MRGFALGKSPKTNTKEERKKRLTKHRALGAFLTIALLSTLLPIQSQGVEKAAWTAGNSDLNIQNGGIMLSDAENFYYTSDGIYRQHGNETHKLSQAAGKNLNLSAGYLYYTLDGVIYRMLEDGSVSERIYEHPTSIEQMYVISNETIWFLSGGAAWCYTMSERSLESLSDLTDIKSLIPTPYGGVFLTGELFSYTIYVRDSPVFFDVSIAYTEEEFLILNMQGKDRQIPLRALFFEEDPQRFLVDFTGKENPNPWVSLYQNESMPTLCTVCEAMAEVADVSVDILSQAAKPLEPLAYTMSLTSGQKNIVKRARQQHEIKWTPLIDRYQWGERGVFQAGVTYTGIPYGQPVNTGYVPWNISFSEFSNAVKDKNSKFNSEYSTYNKTAPYYSSDCSSFVSYAWGTAYRMTTHTLPEVSQIVSDQSMYSLQVGDILNHSTSHVILVTAVGYNSAGQLSSVDIMEQTPMITRRTRYGDGGTKPLSVLQSAYINNGYVIYRNPKRDSVPYTHDCTVPIDGDYCDKCRPTVPVTPTPTAPPKGNGGLPFTDVQETDWYKDAVQYVYEKGLFSGTTITSFSPDASMTRGMFVTVLGRMAGVPAGLKSGIGIVTGSSVNIRQSPAIESAILSICSANQVVQILGTSGNWYQVQHGKIVGYIRSDLLKAYDNHFIDLSANAYDTPYIQWAALIGIANGTTNRIFSPNQSITREEMCVLLWKYSTIYGVILPTSSGIIQPFSDAEDISFWAKEAVQMLKFAGIISGLGGNRVAPKGAASRAEAASVFYKLDLIRSAWG